MSCSDPLNHYANSDKRETTIFLSNNKLILLNRQRLTTWSDPNRLLGRVTLFILTLYARKD